MRNRNIKIVEKHTLWGNKINLDELRQLINSRNIDIISFVVRYKDKTEMEDSLFTKITNKSENRLSYQEYESDKKSCTYDFIYDEFKQFGKLGNGVPINIGKNLEGKIIIHLAHSKTKNTSKIIADKLDVRSLNPDSSIRQAICNLNKKVSGSPIIISDPIRGYLLNPELNWVVYEEYV